MKIKKSVVITGANGGIGKELCKQFSLAKYKVVAVDIHFEANCTHDLYYQMDLQAYVEDENVRAEFIKWLEIFNNKYPIHCLVNNAATQIIGALDDLTVYQARKTFDVNLIAPFLLIKDLKKYLENVKGSVINISSIHAKLTKSKFSLYASSKSGLSGLTRALAVELGSKIKINAIEPAAILTPMLKSGFNNQPEKFEILKKIHPSGDIGEAREVAKLACMMATSESFLNGACISLDGGIGSCLHDPIN